MLHTALRAPKDGTPPFDPAILADVHAVLGREVNRRAAQAGKRVLPMELGYCVGVDGTSDCWRPLWSEVRGGVIVEDTAAYEAWLQGLMDSGTLPRPTPEQCRGQAEKLDNLCAMDPAKAGHSREVKAYERLRDAALRAAEVAA